MGEAKVSKKQQACVNRYVKNHYDRITLNVPKGYKERISDYAKSHGESVNGLVKRLVDAEIGNPTQD